MTTKKRIEDVDFATYCESIETSDLDDFDQVFAEYEGEEK